MNIYKRVAKNIGYLTAGRGVSMIIGFLYITLIARYLGPASYGILAFALALNNMFNVLINFGIDPLTIREIARDKSQTKNYFVNGIVLKILFGTFTFFVIYIVLNVLNYSSTTKTVVYLITLSFIIDSINKLFYDIYLAFERMIYISTLKILRNTMFFLISMFFIISNLNVIFFALLYLITSGAIMLTNTILSGSFLEQSTKIDTHFWRILIKEAWPFALTSGFITIYYWIDSIMLSYMTGDYYVGIYNAAYKILSVMLIIPTIYFSAIYPIMSKLFKRSKEFLGFSVYQSIKYMSIFGFFIGVLGYMLSYEIILLIFGKDYISSANALEILIWSGVCIYLSQPYGYLVKSINKQKVETTITAIASILNVSLNFIVIPHYGYIGASATTLITELFVTLSYIFYFRKTPFLNILVIKNIGKTISISIIMGLIIWTFYKYNVAFGLMLGTFAYFSGLYMIGVIDSTDVLIFKKVIGVKR